MASPRPHSPLIQFLPPSLNISLSMYLCPVLQQMLQRIHEKYETRSCLLKNYLIEKVKLLTSLAAGLNSSVIDPRIYLNQRLGFLTNGLIVQCQQYSGTQKFNYLDLLEHLPYLSYYTVITLYQIHENEQKQQRSCLPLKV